MSKKNLSNLSLGHFIRVDGVLSVIRRVYPTKLHYYGDDFIAGVTAKIGRYEGEDSDRFFRFEDYVSVDGIVEEEEAETRETTSAYGLAYHNGRLVYIHHHIAYPLDGGKPFADTSGALTYHVLADWCKRQRDLLDAAFAPAIERIESHYDFVSRQVMSQLAEDHSKFPPGYYLNNFLCEQDYPDEEDYR